MTNKYMQLPKKDRKLLSEVYSCNSSSFSRKVYDFAIKTGYITEKQRKVLQKIRFEQDYPFDWDESAYDFGLFETQ